MSELVYNLRYPGQYFDSETGLSQNVYRDYDPQTGRYAEPDPAEQLLFLRASLLRRATGWRLRAGYWNSLYGYADAAPIGEYDPFGLYGIVVSAGFHIPVSPGIAVGPAVSSSIENYSNNPRLDLSYDGARVEAEAGVIVDAGVAFGINDISNTGGKCEGATLTLGLGRRAGISVTLRSSQDLSKFILNPLRYIDGFSLGIGAGIAAPVSASAPVSGAMY